jgi:hypothetical protein
MMTGDGAFWGVGSDLAVAAGGEGLVRLGGGLADGVGGDLRFLDAFSPRLFFWMEFFWLWV